MLTTSHTCIALNNYKYNINTLIMFSDKPKVKLYRDQNGQIKGDGRCCYLKVHGFYNCYKNNYISLFRKKSFIHQNMMFNVAFE